MIRVFYLKSNEDIGNSRFVNILLVTNFWKKKKKSDNSKYLIPTLSLYKW